MHEPVRLLEAFRPTAQGSVVEEAGASIVPEHQAGLV